MGERRQSALAAMALAVALGLGVTAAHAARTVSAGTATEAWYLTTPLGGAPGGPSLNPYPSGTLHVGAVAGQEESRSYLTLDLSDVPGGAQILGGTLVLPIAENAGTRAPETARIQLCRAVAPAESVAGSTATPPPADCTLSADAVFVDARNAFEVDLDPLADFLDGGLAVVPNVAADATWHVGFHGTTDDAGAPRIEAQLQLADASSEDGSPVSPAFDSMSFSAAVHPEAVPPPLPSGLGAATSTAGGASLAPPPPAQGGATVASARPAGMTSPGAFRYSIVFGLPLVLLIGVPYFGLSLSAPVRPRRPRSTPPA